VKLPAAAMRAFCFLIFPPFILTRGKRERERERERKKTYLFFSIFVYFSRGGEAGLISWPRLLPLPLLLLLLLNALD